MSCKPAGQSRVGSRRLPRCGGYTLVEFIVAMALVALVMVLLTGGLFLASRGWERIDAKTTRVTDVRQSFEFLRTRLAAAREVTLRLPDGLATLFWGDSRMLEWVAPLPAYVGPGGLSVMRLSLVVEDAAKTLVLERWLLHPESLGDDAWATPAWVPMTPLAAPAESEESVLYGRHVLIEGVAEFELAYFGAVEQGARPQWHDRWAGVAALPRLVRIRLSQPSETWPDVLIELPDPIIRL
jgi:general secretion pathway protein J